MKKYKNAPVYFPTRKSELYYISIVKTVTSKCAQR